MDSLLHDWPEPVVAVQSIAESGSTLIPNKYVKPAADRPTVPGSSAGRELSIPIIDLGKLAGGVVDCRAVIRAISDACRDWGFFQVVNHGVDMEVVRAVLGVWREFFKLPMEEKKKLANSPRTYEGYGSRLGVEKDSSLDWGDYFYLHLLPHCIKNFDKWPTVPGACREITEEYGRQMVNLCETVMKVLSMSLGFDVGFLKEKFGGEEIGACMRVNYYPTCPQPELTLGLSAHSDPGGLTVLLADDRVPGLQVRKGNDWVTVNPIPGALIINVGDQIQVLSNATYKSVEHRVVVNEAEERLSIAFFYNPKSDLPLEPVKELITQDRPQLYRAMTFNEYRLYIRKKGPSGKTQVESLKAM
ncbi:probable 2-oxoglutarate-dependent dioxygenase At5g05600 [Dendrobium catenatum]|uniref:Flavonol synthase/flavanone 3-hydroxylase n=1 Tax=Dendrobium catenatum TaxID=906689 RepID=A0A2I0VP92_9ASPA|nr:probable 2-oxoglutarate-dependent dioxygenase At5g05600 [Dendrobium catenatum]PKU65234.1 Flavonol synthase/flavanone 3-hydroxylase [Dendrobium catenatum]